jgi:uncharacterized protein (DUF2252 family)
MTVTSPVPGRARVTRRPSANGSGSLDERVATGREARKRAPRSSFGDWRPSPARPDPVGVLVRQGETRVQELLPIRHGRMLASPFAFLRGGAAIMAHDLVDEPATGLVVQLCGDAHLGNFGTYAGPDRRLVFDLNDFDETCRGPFEWDVKRLAASVEVVARVRDFAADARRNAVLETAAGYREAMRRLARLSTLEVWYRRIDLDEIRNVIEDRGDLDDLRKLDRHVTRARERDNLRALRNLTEETAEGRRFRHDPPLLVPLRELVTPDELDRTAELLRDYLRQYRTALPPAARALLDRFQLVDLAQKVVGVGSVGMRAWVLLFLGRDDADPLVLQVKEAQPAVLEPHLRTRGRRAHGRRVVEGQQLMQSASDVLLGWLTATAPDGARRDFYVRQLWDAKGSVDLDGMTSRRLRAYGRLCGIALARAHARAGDPVAIAAYLGGGDTFDRAIAAFAATYAEVTYDDHAALERAVARGVVDAEVER